MFTPRESKPLVGKLFAMIAVVAGSSGTIAAVSTIIYVVAAGTSSEAAGWAALLGAASLGVIVVGVPCAIYSLYCRRTKLAWIGLGLCFVPFVISLAATRVAGGGHR